MGSREHVVFFTHPVIAMTAPMWVYDGYGLQFSAEGEEVEVSHCEIG